VSETGERTPVTVRIAGDEYSIRALASPEYTQDCAAYVDRKLSDVMRPGSLIQPHKGAILAALMLADELFQARAELDALKEELTRRADTMVTQIEDRLAAGDLAAGS
jgi:cell division protein ZapA